MPLKIIYNNIWISNDFMWKHVRTCILQLFSVIQYFSFTSESEIICHCLFYNALKFVFLLRLYDI